jgi:hypothetical protein
MCLLLAAFIGKSELLHIGSTNGSANANRWSHRHGAAALDCRHFLVAASGCNFSQALLSTALIPASRANRSPCHPTNAPPY